jgi:hypothetical protein
MGNQLSVEANQFTTQASSDSRLPAHGKLWLSDNYPHVGVVKDAGSIESPLVAEQGLNYLKKKVSMLPKSIYSSSLEVDNAKDTSATGVRINYKANFLVGTYTAADLVNNQNVRLPDEDFFWYLLNFLIKTGRELEAQMEYHPDIGPHTISVNPNGDLMLTTPYMNIKYAKDMLEVRTANHRKDYR